MKPRRILGGSLIYSPKSKYGPYLVCKNHTFTQNWDWLGRPQDFSMSLSTDYTLEVRHILSVMVIRRDHVLVDPYHGLLYKYNKLSISSRWPAVPRFEVSGLFSMPITGYSLVQNLRYYSSRTNVNFNSEWCNNHHCYFVIFALFPPFYPLYSLY